MEGMALGGDGQLEAITTVRVSHVPAHVTETEFNCWFIFAFGFEQATLGPAKGHGGRSGWARFGTVEAAQAAIQNLDGRQLTVHQSPTEAVLAAELAKKNFVSAKPTGLALAKRQRLEAQQAPLPGPPPAPQALAPAQYASYSLHEACVEARYSSYSLHEADVEALPIDAQAAHQAAASVVQQFMTQPIEAQRQDASQVWYCPACGSQNLGNRPFCSTSICGLAKPGLTAQDVLGSVSVAPADAAVGHGAGEQHGVAYGDVGGHRAPGDPSWPEPAATDQAIAVAPGAVQAAPPSWVHPPSACTDVVAEAPPQPQGLTAFVGAGACMPQTATELQMQMLGLDQGQLATIVGGLGALGTEGAQEAAPFGAPGGVHNPPGCWTCTACFNTNWPTRTTCNGKRSGSICGMYRSLSDGATLPTSPPGARASGGPPAGSWICTSCSNVNWPTRTTCNAKHCQRPRDQVDGGAPRVVPPPPQLQAAQQVPPEAQQGPAPEGAWACVMCQNVNWPLRTHCNKRTCGAPRPF